MAITAAVNGVMPVIGRNTVDSAHNSGYAAGYLYNKVKPRMAMTTHMGYDAYSNPELLAEIRYHYKGPFHFGAPDMVVVNLTQRQGLGSRRRDPGFPEPGAAEIRHRRDGRAGHSGSAQQATGLPGAIDSRRGDSAGRILSAGLQAGTDPVLADDKPIFIPAAQVPPGLWLGGKPAAAAQPASDAGSTSSNSTP